MRNHTPKTEHLTSGDAPAQTVVIVIVFSGQALAQEPDVCKSTFADKHQATDAWQRVFMPGHEILAQGLPAPDV
jgi:hypothetical protein